MLIQKLPRGAGEIDLNERPEGQQVDGNRVRYPFLLECDTQGRVLWMDENTRAAFGSIEYLVEAIPSKLEAIPDQPIVGELSLTRIWEGGGRILLGARHPAAPDEDETLLGLERSLLRNYIRLQEAEKVLSDRARERRGTGFRSPVQQIEAERQRLGRELHTSVGQLLSAVRLQLEVITSQLPDPIPSVQQALDRIAALTADALERVRSISQRLHPPEWQRLPIEIAIRQMWDLSGIPENFDARMDLVELPDQPDLDLKVLIYRAAQEAISNVVRHSRATRVHAELEVRDRKLVLRFQDNGAGFDAQSLLSAPPSLTGGIGLRTIREQTEALGGTLVVDSSPEGTKLELTIPFPSERP
jgi:signal transduction histidine kinase